MAGINSHKFLGVSFTLFIVIFQNISFISSAVATPTLPSLIRAPPIITLPTVPSSSKNVVNPQSAVNPTSNSDSDFYKNPIIPWADPYGISVYLHSDGFYYAVSVHPPDHQETQRSESIFVMRSRKLTDWTNAHAQTKRDVLQLNGTLDPNSDRWIFGPRLERIDGAWYIFFSMEDNETISTSRYYVIEGKGENPLEAQFGAPIELLPPGDTEYTMFKGTVLNYGPGELYFVFSAHAGRTSYNNSAFRAAKLGTELLIAPMSSPTQISGSPVGLLSKGADPQILRKPGLDYRESIFMVYNEQLASHNPDACLAAMRLDYGFHPLVQENWKPVQDGRCLFYKNEKEGVYAVAGASFTTSPDGAETWVVYKATSSPTAELKERNIRAERIGWDTISGEPVFPRPGGLNLRYKVPRENSVSISNPNSNPLLSSFGWRSGPVISLPTVPGSTIVELPLVAHTTEASRIPTGGGLGEKRQPNQQVTNLVQKLAPEIHAAACRKLGVSLERKDCRNEDVSLTLVEYKQQVVAGTNYFVKLSREVNSVKEFWHARIFEQTWTKTLQLTGVEGPKNEKDEINYF